MQRGETVIIHKWFGLPDDDHTWAFYYYLKGQDHLEVRKRVRDDVVDIVTKRKEIYEMDSSS